MRTLKRWLAMAVVGMMLAACSGGGGGDDKKQPQDPQAPAEITSITPATVTAGSPAFTLTVRGLNFTTASIVKVDGVLRRDAVIVGPTRITIPMTATDIAVAGEVTITVDSETAFLTVTGMPWKTADNAPAKAQKMGVDGLLYEVYEQNGDVLLTRFDELGEKVPIAEESDVAVAETPQNEEVVGLAVTGRTAHVAVRKGVTTTTGLGDVVLVSVDLITGAKTERTVMQNGLVTGFADDGAGAIFIAFATAQGTSVIRGIDTASMQSVFEQAFATDRKMIAVAANGTTVYMGGLITNGTGGQARILIRTVERSTGTARPEIQLTATARSTNSDILHPGSFILDPGSDALYFSGVLDSATAGAQGVTVRLKASAGTLEWALIHPTRPIEYSFELMTADANGDVYGYHRPSDSVVRLNPATPTPTTLAMWRAKTALQPEAIYATGGIVYIPRPSGVIVRLTRDNAPATTVTPTAPQPPPAPGDVEVPEAEIEEPEAPEPPDPAD